MNTKQYCLGLLGVGLCVVGGAVQGQTLAKPVSSNAHALIMTIGDYPGPIPKLTGVAQDVATAKGIAQRLGVPEANVLSYRDKELSLEGMRAALDGLEAKLDGNSQVFIYYSGHGGRQQVEEENGTARCAEMLVTYDAKGMSDAELEQRMKRIAARSQKTVMFIDACHSGGVTTRSVPGKSAAFTAKSYSAPGKQCTQPVNVLTRNIKIAKAPGAGAANFVHIAAAREDEISLDQPGRGGVASQAWLACLSGAAADLDGSGGLSGDEIRACAQTRINLQLQGVSGYLPHHVSLTGNGQMVLSYAGGENGTAGAPKPSALATLNDIYNNRDDRRLVTVSAPRSQLRIGKDRLDFNLSSREGGFVYVLMAGSDGEKFDLLFPNALDKQNRIAPGGAMRLPATSWQMDTEGPPGKNTLLVMVSDTPRDFTAAGFKPTEGFYDGAKATTRGIHLVTSKPAQNKCADPARCSSSYGAALLTIEEVY